MIFPVRLWVSFPISSSTSMLILSRTWGMLSSSLTRRSSLESIVRKFLTLFCRFCMVLSDSSSVWRSVSSLSSWPLTTSADGLGDVALLGRDQARREGGTWNFADVQ